MLVIPIINSVGSREIYKDDFVALSVEGAAELDVLCPVSKSTGFRTSIVDAVKMVSDKDSRLAETLMVELPPLVYDKSVSDDDKLRLLASRLHTGSFAENDSLTEAIGKVAKEFFPEADVEKVVEEIKPSDSSQVQEVVDNV